MRVGILVDGIAEYQSLPRILGKIDHPHRPILVAKADLQPLAPIGQLTRTISDSIDNVFTHKRIEKLIVVIDRDGRDSCAKDWAIELQQAVSVFCSPIVKVVIKNDRFENWLISDPLALQMLRGFSVSTKTKAQIAGAADNLNGRLVMERILRAGSNGKASTYDKTLHATRILTKSDPMNMARNSRSFRRFLRLLDCPAYSTQSKRPV